MTHFTAILTMVVLALSTFACGIAPGRQAQRVNFTVVNDASHGWGVTIKIDNIEMATDCSLDSKGTKTFGVEAHTVTSDYASVLCNGAPAVETSVGGAVSRSMDAVFHCTDDGCTEVIEAKD